jgi:hypothetical protein
MAGTTVVTIDEEYLKGKDSKPSIRTGYGERGRNTIIPSSREAGGSYAFDPNNPRFEQNIIVTSEEGGEEIIAKLTTDDLKAAQANAVENPVDPARPPTIEEIQAQAIGTEAKYREISQLKQASVPMSQPVATLGDAAQLMTPGAVSVPMPDSSMMAPPGYVAPQSLHGGGQADAISQIAQLDNPRSGDVRLPSIPESQLDPAQMGTYPGMETHVLPDQLQPDPVGRSAPQDVLIRQQAQPGEPQAAPEPASVAAQRDQGGQPQPPQLHQVLFEGSFGSFQAGFSSIFKHGIKLILVTDHRITSQSFKPPISEEAIFVTVEGQRMACISQDLGFTMPDGSVSFAILLIDESQMGV